MTGVLFTARSNQLHKDISASVIYILRINKQDLMEIPLLIYTPFGEFILSI